ncbi:winged helix-turn-helix domain-containing protein [Streptomyces sp. S-2]|uniref:winged helix-turn-helix domain-containing protein n=1 Tax=Streptomyces sp. S-2 TaxID=2675217 RepID=UPI001436B1F0|nr:winged helix-turn-helix domain-containing protein [Streptomyces sp. S-2]
MGTTNQKAFRIRILQALRDLGGTGSKQQTLQRIEDLYGHELTDEDWLPCRTRPEPLWHNRAAWERSDMVRDGLLDARSPRNMWALTEAGYSAVTAD